MSSPETPLCLLKFLGTMAVCESASLRGVLSRSILETPLCLLKFLCVCEFISLRGLLGIFKLETPRCGLKFLRGLAGSEVGEGLPPLSAPSVDLEKESLMIGPVLRARAFLRGHLNLEI